MEHVFAVKNQEELALYQAFLQDARPRLEEYIRSFRGTVVVISHDRYFLDRVVTRVIEIQGGKAEFYSGNYSFYAVEKERRYLEKLRRLCILMRRMSWEDYEDGTNKVELYRELFPNTPDRTRQRDFKELEQLGYEVWYERGFEDEPGRRHYDIPSAYGLATIPGMRC